MPVFQDTPARTFELPPEGDQILRVVGFEIGISNTGKTNGSEQYDVTFQSESNGATFDCTLWDHPNTWWKVDNWLKSSGVPLSKGQAFEFRADVANQKRVLWVDPIGLRCHAKVTHRPGTKDPSKRFAEVAIFYTDKPKLPRHVEDAPASEPQPDAW